MQSIEEWMELAKKGNLLKELEIKYIMQKVIEVFQKGAKC